jgi:WhiB family redox-sensing transcriptional regulator
VRREITDLIEGKYPEFLENLEIPIEITSGGACTGVDTNLFFSKQIMDVNQARAICGTCPIIEVCLDYATFAEEFGVWGGATAGERKKLRQGKPLFTLEERRFAVDFRNDLKRITAEAFALKYKMTVRNCFRWKVKLGVEDLAS